MKEKMCNFMHYIRCEKCGNMYVCADIEGVDLSCGAFTDFMNLDAQDILNYKISISPNLQAGIGDIEMNMVYTCGGKLSEITEEEVEKIIDKMRNKKTFNGIRERK